MDKKLYEMPFLKVNRFEVINPLMVEDIISSPDGGDDGEVEEEE